jgi:hypothetical protein
MIFSVQEKFNQNVNNDKNKIKSEGFKSNHVELPVLDDEKPFWGDE